MVHNSFPLQRVDTRLYPKMPLLNVHFALCTAHRVCVEETKKLSSKILSKNDQKDLCNLSMRKMVDEFK